MNADILALTGEDAGKERYLAFLGQILLMSRLQHDNLGLKPLVMIFTPTSWLIPRPTYVHFRKKWDAEFAFRCGFIVTSNEWFKLDGKWPLAFSIWEYSPDAERIENKVVLSDLTELKKSALNVEWNSDVRTLDFTIGGILKAARRINFSSKRIFIKDLIGQRMNDFKRDPTKVELKIGGIIGGLPRRDPRRENKKTYGVNSSIYIGLMDDNTPVRIGQDSALRMTNQPDRVWFQLRPTFIDINLTKVQTAPPDKYGYCAFDLDSSKSCFAWFAITKALNGSYPVWANQFDIWMPNLPKEKEAAFYSLCFAFVLAENRCVVTKFEANNPVAGAPEVFVHNPLSTNNENAFWQTTLLPFVEESAEPNALALVKTITEFYRYWNHNYTKGQFIEHVGLHNEPYFRYFDYPDFLTPNSGLIQIRKYAEIHQEMALLSRFEEIQAAAKVVKKAIYEMLVRDCRYFD